ncbi:MAG: ECF-type sigma factor [Bacteroidota bacterium]
MPSPADPFDPSVTRLLDAASRGESDALDEVFPLVYGELQRLARKVRSGRAGATLNTTALVHEAYLKLVRTDGMEWAGRQHFFRVAARAMRQVLVRDATRRQTDKRGGGQAPVALNEAFHGGTMADEDMLALDEALKRLESLDARQAAVVEIRFFTGLTLEETADTLGVSVPTVSRDWRMARVWLARALAA